MSVSEIDVLDAGRVERNVTLHGADILAALESLLAGQGEVADSPAANTIADRLKSIQALLAAQSGYQDGIEGGLAPLATQATLALVLAAVLAGVRGLVADSAGTLFDPDSGSHVYGLNAAGAIVTDTCVLAGVTRVKTYTRDVADRVTAESQWAPQ